MSRGGGAVSVVMNQQDAGSQFFYLLLSESLDREHEICLLLVKQYTSHYHFYLRMFVNVYVIIKNIE